MIEEGDSQRETERYIKGESPKSIEEAKVEKPAFSSFQVLLLLGIHCRNQGKMYPGLNHP